jgi:hypothetical protein
MFTRVRSAVKEGVAPEALLAIPPVVHAVLMLAAVLLRVLVLDDER